MRFLLIQPFSLCLYAFSLPAVVHPAKEDKGCTRVQWMARKFELMALAKYRTVSSRRSSCEDNENCVVSPEVLLVNNVDQHYSDDDQEQEHDNDLLDYDIQCKISNNYEEFVGRRDSVMSEKISINDGSISTIENIVDNVELFFDDKEQRNSHKAADGSITFLR